MTTNIKDLRIIISYDIIHNTTCNKKKLNSMKKLPKIKNISALALIAKYLQYS